MAIDIQIDDTVRFPVKGKLFDAEGREREFHFDVDMQRMDQDQFDKELANTQITVRSLVERLAKGWAGVKGADGEDVPFSSTALKQLLRIPGLCNLIWVAYCEYAGARAKNSPRSSA
jgi:hypothetical protein